MLTWVLICDFLSILNEGNFRGVGLRGDADEYNRASKVSFHEISAIVSRETCIAPRPILPRPGGAWLAPPLRCLAKRFPRRAIARAQVLHDASRHSRPQLGNLRFQFGDPLVALGERFGHIRGVELLRNVLRAIRIPGLHREQDHLLGPRLVVFGHQPCRQRRIPFDHPRLAPDLDALPERIVDEEEIRLGIFSEIARRDILPVSGKIDESDGLVVDRARKPAGPPRCWI